MQGSNEVALTMDAPMGSCCQAGNWFSVNKSRFRVNQ
jgi:hypothetical protein